MTTTSLSRRSPLRNLLAADPSRQAYLLLRTVFTVAPIVFGLDKFANVLVDWPRYLAPWINDVVPGTAQQAMYVVGVVEVVAGSRSRCGRGTARCSSPPGWPASSSTCCSSPTTTTSRCATSACWSAALALSRLAVAHEPARRSNVK